MYIYVWLFVFICFLSSYPSQIENKKLKIRWNWSKNAEIKAFQELQMKNFRNSLKCDYISLFWWYLSIYVKKYFTIHMRYFTAIEIPSRVQYSVFFCNSAFDDIREYRMIFIPCKRKILIVNWDYFVVSVSRFVKCEFLSFVCYVSFYGKSVLVRNGKCEKLEF